MIHLCESNNYRVQVVQSCMMSCTSPRSCLVSFQWLHSLSHHKNPFLPTHAVPSPFPGTGTPDVTRARTALAPAPAQGCAGVGALDFSHLASTPSDDSTPRITFEDDRSTGTPKDDVSRSRTVTASAGVLNSARDNDYIQRQVRKAGPRRLHIDLKGMRGTAV